MVIENSASLDRVEHRRVERVAVVQDVDAVARQERHAGRAGHRRQELLVVYGELVVEPVAGWELGGRDQVTDERHRAGAGRPAPLVVDHRPQEDGAQIHQDHSSRRARDQNGIAPFRLASQRIRRHAVAPAPHDALAAELRKPRRPAGDDASGRRGRWRRVGRAIGSVEVEDIRQPAELGGTRLLRWAGDG